LYTQAKLDAAKQNMQRLLLDNGYYHSTIISSGKRDANTQRSTFLSHPARCAGKVGKVTFRGDSGSNRQNAGHHQLHPGDKVSAAHVRRALERLRKRYQRRDRLEAQVAVVERTYRPDSNYHRLTPSGSTAVPRSTSK